ncbi:MAG TPA: hypothetical protein VG347_05175, partial [Verrucomicrobiae bacterium]|nr:hypothetical protein [Verrucomicrobiae bacterium]
MSENFPEPLSAYLLGFLKIFENQKNRQYGPLHPSPRQRPGVRQSSGAFLESQANLTANRWKTNPP